MDFQEADKSYKDLRAQHAAGQLNDADFEAQVNGLKVQDSQGHWWQLGVRSGEWYYNDGQNWVKSRPPSASAPTGAPASSPEDAAGEKPAAGATASLPPRRLFSAKPADRNGGGLPRGVLIGIIAGVAVIAVVCILVGYFFFTGNNNLNPFRAAATRTPTQAVVIAPSPVLPTLPPPPPVATPAPPTLLPSPSPVVTNTVASGTTPATTPRPSVAARPSATPTSGTPKPTNTPNAAPGVYVTKITAENVSSDTTKFIFTFRITFFNNTGGNWHNPSENGWVLYIFKVDSQDKVYGQTRIVKDIDIPVGTNVITLSDAWQVGPAGGSDCKYIVGAYSLDNNMSRMAFLQPDGKQFTLLLSACQ